MVNDLIQYIIFIFQFVIGVPSYEQRLEVLKSLTVNLPLSSDVELELLAKQCLGYVAADLTALVRQSTLNALSNTMERSNTGIWIFPLLDKLFKSLNLIAQLKTAFLI